MLTQTELETVQVAVDLIRRDAAAIEPCERDVDLIRFLHAIVTHGNSALRLLMKRAELDALGNSLPLLVHLPKLDDGDVVESSQ
jgi:hypothetical protein